MAEVIDQQTVPEKKYCPVCGKAYGAEEKVCPDDGSVLAVQDPLVGTILADRYKVLSVLGRGGMSIVYKARHTLMDRIVAIKLLHVSLVSDPASLTRFQREAKAVSALNHPNVIFVYDFGVAENGLPFLVMDYLEGQSLGDVLKDQGRILINRGASIFVQSCEALQHAHAKGVVHRDLKPSNIMLVNNDGNADYVKIVDFGIAKLLNPGEESQKLTQTGEVVGSPLYMSPEQLMGRALDARSDIYSMGCVMYETLAGKPPFIGDNIIDTMRKHLDEMPMPLRQVRSDINIPDELEAVIFKALAKIPEQRQDTMADLTRELKHAVRSITPELSTYSPSSTGTATPRLGSPQAVTSKQTLKLPIAPGRQIETTPGILIAVLSAIVILGSIVLYCAVAPNGPMQHYLTQTRYKQYSDARDKFAGEQKFDDAQKMALLAVEEASHLSDKEKLLNSLVNLGVVYRINKDYANAQKTFETSLSLAIDIHGKDNINVADCLDQLGALADYRNEYKNAEKLLLQSLAIKKQLLGMNDPETATTLDFMAQNYVQAGQNTKGAEAESEYAKAEPLFKQALAIRQKVLGQADPLTTRELNNLALLYEHQKRFNEAEPLYKQVIETYKQTVGPNDPELITPLQDYADLLRETGRASEARALDAQVYKITNAQSSTH
jgi:serine/threonine-protein kinase